MTYDRVDYINRASPIETELKKLFNTRSSITIFEIGSCEGEDSIKYARLFPNSKIYTFEPLPKNIERIKQNFLKYNISNAEIWNLAVSTDEGTAEFFVSEGKPENVDEVDWDFGNKSSSLLPPDQHIKQISFIKFNEKILVKTISLDQFCRQQEVNLIDFIHMDVQGAELLVLKGAGKFLEKIKVIWLEVAKIALYKDQPLIGDVEQFMYDNGFYLAKSEVDNNAGDQLYISKKFYKDFEKILKESKPSIWRRMLNKFLS